MTSFDDVIVQLCKIRKCCLLSHNGNMLVVKSGSVYDDLAYFKAICDCYMATNYGSTTWIERVDFEEHTIELGYNY